MEFRLTTRLRSGTPCAANHTPTTSCSSRSSDCWASSEYSLLGSHSEYRRAASRRMRNPKKNRKRKARKGKFTSSAILLTANKHVLKWNVFFLLYSSIIINSILWQANTNCHLALFRYLFLKISLSMFTSFFRVFKFKN